jgi:hypothetical protein
MRTFSNTNEAPWHDVPAAGAVPLDTAVRRALQQFVELIEDPDGYGRTRSDPDGLRDPRRALAELLVRRGHDGASIARLAVQAAWPLPDAVACVALAADKPPAGLEPDVLVLSGEGEVWLVVPGVHGCIERLRERLSGYHAALGPIVPVEDAWSSMHCARLALRLGRRDPPQGLRPAGDRPVDLLLLDGEPVTRLLAELFAGLFAGLPRGKAARLAETLEALLASRHRTATEVATALGIHAQTARYRLRQLDRILGDLLDDPLFRLHLQLSLRAARLRFPDNE